MIYGMESIARFRRLSKLQSRTERWFIVIGIVAAVFLGFQALALPSGTVFASLLPVSRIQVLVENNFETVNPSCEPACPLVLKVLSEVLAKTEATDSEAEALQDAAVSMKRAEEDLPLARDGATKEDLALDGDQDSVDENSLEEVSHLNNHFELQNSKSSGGRYSSESAKEPRIGLSEEKVMNNGIHLVSEKFRGRENGSVDISGLNKLVIGKSYSRTVVLGLSVGLNGSGVALIEQKRKKGKNEGSLQSFPATSMNSRIESRLPMIIKRGKSTSIPEMNRLLHLTYSQSHLSKPRWFSAGDRELFSLKMQIDNVHTVKNDLELYSPAFRNVSLFKRSYEMMEKKLKVYIYKEGEKPIFHQPYLRGIYASEGWFMKLMAASKKFVVKRPQKAHLFYLPFSSRILRSVMITQESHNRRKLIEFLKAYIDIIAAKYPFWNRTNGADHFLVACHDWAPYETKMHLRNSLRALCNADASKDFVLGKDVSLPATSVRSSRNPLKHLGGKPASERTILAFFAGNMHGNVRPILLKHWENRDPDMKILGPLPRGADGKTTYINYMKTSKYCICARGHEVYSPRVVEAIFHECVPVVLSDNYVPPFFEVLNWEAFSVFVAEKDIPFLKDILQAIPQEKYLSMLWNVKQVQRHFLWHSKPVRYDIFHMILHSIWFNRLHQLRTR